MDKPISLYELNCRIKAIVSGAIPAVWITAEIAELNLNRSGHCYLQLADKGEKSEQPIAVARATVWASTYRLISSYFVQVTGRTLERGMRVMLLVEPIFHELYGFSLNVKNIEPSFTIGDLERRRREILEQLKSDGVIDMNRSLEFPVFPKRIAVISSHTAAGWGDFKTHLAENSYGYTFNIKLFPAIMQGDGAESSLLNAFDLLAEEVENFDAVVIIRGGGSQTDLGCFDSYNLASYVAQFPIPVISGIGHERDVTVIDYVAHTRVKTPTAAADLFIEAFVTCDALCRNMAERLKRVVNSIVSDEKLYNERLTNRFATKVKDRLSSEASLINLYRQKALSNMVSTVERRKERLNMAAVRVKGAVRQSLIKNGNRLEKSELVVRYSDPVRVLERGYSIALHDGKAVRSAKELKRGDCVTMRFADGYVETTVNKEYGE
ncbi:MAG: exodeoxyribonuclease VII large subunit [Bacteroidales bacterium]|nr:exodeoxyribonuclease VII large subunit [Bacteroidales bacterium]